MRTSRPYTNYDFYSIYFVHFFLFKVVFVFEECKKYSGPRGQEPGRQHGGGQLLSLLFIWRIFFQFKVVFASEKIIQDPEAKKQAVSMAGASFAWEANPEKAKKGNKANKANNRTKEGEKKEKEVKEDIEKMIDEKNDIEKSAVQNNKEVLFYPL
jgi:hypothetical protein